MPLHVNVDNFVRVETARMLSDIQQSAGGVNVFRHNRQPAAIDEQTVIRLNRDTLYSFAVVDVSRGADLTLPETDGRYLSAMVVNEGHYVVDVLHDAGVHHLTADHVGSGHALVAVRTLVDPNDPADLTEVAAIQDGVVLSAGSAEPFEAPDYDTTTLDQTRDALLDLARNLVGFDHTFGSREEVDPVRHLIGTAAGWGGLPTSEAAYVGVDPKVAPGSYELTLRDVPVDAFWSVSVYNAAGFFEPNASGRYTLNSVTADRNDDGSVTVRFVPDDSVTGSNAIPVPGEGWNYLVRLYRPRAEFLDGSWLLPSLELSPAQS
jgi:hypothetical protein